jgi:hypothetical protein
MVASFRMTAAGAVVRNGTSASRNGVFMVLSSGGRRGGGSVGEGFGLVSTGHPSGC